MRTLETLFCLCILWGSSTWGKEETTFTNMWVARIHGGEEVAKRVARDLGFNFEGQSGPALKDYYHLTRDDLPERTKDHSHHLTRSLLNQEEVHWAEQQTILRRSHRGVVPKRNQKKFLGEKLLDYGAKLYYSKTQGDLSLLGTFQTTPMDASSLELYSGPTKNVGLRVNKKSAYATFFEDPNWVRQWYVQDYRTSNIPVLDHNVVPVYRDKKFTGKGITIAVVDDGVEHNHPDLEGNFQEHLSYDLCLNKPGSNPTSPKQVHGTRCAGEIAMVANNALCGVGIAYEAHVAGMRTICSGKTMDSIEAKSLVHGLNNFDIYSNSWGPVDDGSTLETLSDLKKTSFETGLRDGRGGKGAIYVFACGNGKADGDNCGADVLINNLATISIASASATGKTTWYGERCAGIYAVAYSSGGFTDEDVATTDVNKGCTTGFAGTSASCPLATGMIALTLQANPELTYRDVMHIITMSAEVAPIANNKDTWYKNAAGFWVSNDFGFGLFNAENMVTEAQRWKTVPERHTCSVEKVVNEELVDEGDPVVISIETDGCQDPPHSSDTVPANAVFFLEQVELVSNIQFHPRGAIVLRITSPKGTKTTLLESRPKDTEANDLKDWPIKSLHTWGEDPKGTWLVQVELDTSIHGDRRGKVVSFKLNLHGTAEKPDHFKRVPRTYSAFRTPEGHTSEKMNNKVEVNEEEDQ